MKFNKFLTQFNNGKTVYIEDSILWYCLEIGIDWYLNLNINQRICFKQSYFDLADSKNEWLYSA